MTHPRPPFLLRMSIVIGGVVLLLGVVGAVMLVLREQGTRPDLTLRLRLQGPATAESVVVEVSWEQDGSEVRQQARRSEEPGLWILPPVPPDRPITIVVLDRATEPPRVIAQTDVEPSDGDELRLEVRRRGP